MDKILLEILCPATSKRYDFWVSKRMCVGKVKNKILSEIREFEKNDSIFQDEDQIVLFRENGDILNHENITMSHSGINSGECLMLI